MHLGFEKGSPSLYTLATVMQTVVDSRQLSINHSCFLDSFKY